MAKKWMLGVAAFLVGVALGLAVWSLIWSRTAVWLSGYPEPWEVTGGELVINDFWGAVGKVVSLLALPMVGGVFFSKLVVEWLEERQHLKAAVTDGPIGRRRWPRALARVVFGVVVAVGVVAWLSEGSQDKLTPPDEDAFVEAVAADVAATGYWTTALLLEAGYDACEDLERTGGDPRPVIDDMTSSLDAIGSEGQVRALAAHDMMVVLENAPLLCPDVRG